MSLPPIKIEFVGQDGQFQAVAARVSARMASLQDRIKSVGQRMQDLGARAQAAGRRMSYASAAAAAAGVGMYKLASGAAQAGDRVAKAARQAGVGATYWQEHAYAIGQVTDITEDELNTAMTRLTKVIGEAQEGSKGASAALEKLGFSQQQIAEGSIGTEAAFDAFVRTMDGAKSPAEAAALSVDLFGKAGAALGTQLVGAGDEVTRLRDEAQKLGLVMGDKSVSESEKFADNIDRVQQRLALLGREIGERLLPIFNETLIPAFENKVIPALQAVANWVLSAMEAFQNLPGPVQEAIGVIAAGFALGGPVMLALGLVLNGVGRIVGAFGKGGLIGIAVTAGLYIWAEYGDEIKKGLGDALDWVMEKLDRMLAKAREIGAALAKALNVQAPGAGGFEPDHLGNTPMNDAFNDAYSGGGGGGAAAAQSMGLAMVNGMVLGVTQGLEARGESLRDLFGRVGQIAREVLEIHSPSALFQRLGTFVGEGLANGIAATAGMVTGAVQAMTGGVTAGVSETVQSVLGSLSTMFTKSKGLALAQAAVNIGVGMSEALKLPFPANIAAMFKTAAAGAQAVSTIRSASPGGGGQIATGASGGAPVAAAAAPRPAQVLVTTQGPLAALYDWFIGSLAEQLRKDYGDAGYVLASGAR